ncbi:Xin actin-binding repeat-containing protein 2 [Apodemus speciosus]|uniref:Xin actin-binding repeat-containing protein 2 n=1 Tax=Apodemus speciosus TaxID=105296 RepID=A0ABQ0EHQ6_APOSI
MDNLEPSTFPIQKGSLSLLRQKWESSDYQRNESSPGGSRCRLFQLKESNFLDPEGEVPSALNPPEPPSLSCSTMEDALSGEHEGRVPEEQNDKLKDCGQPEVVKEDSLTGRRRIERFSIALDELRSIFESPKSGMNPAGPVEYVQK